MCQLSFFDTFHKNNLMSFPMCHRNPLCQTWCHNLKNLSEYIAACKGNYAITGRVPSQDADNTRILCFLAAAQTFDTSRGVKKPLSSPDISQRNGSMVFYRWPFHGGFASSNQKWSKYHISGSNHYKFVVISPELNSLENNWMLNRSTKFHYECIKQV